MRCSLVPGIAGEVLFTQAYLYFCPLSAGSFRILQVAAGVGICAQRIIEYALFAQCSRGSLERSAVKLGTSLLILNCVIHFLGGGSVTISRIVSVGLNAVFLSLGYVIIDLLLSRALPPSPPTTNDNALPPANGASPLLDMTPSTTSNPPTASNGAPSLGDAQQPTTTPPTQDVPTSVNTASPLQNEENFQQEVEVNGDSNNSQPASLDTLDDSSATNETRSANSSQPPNDGATSPPSTATCTRGATSDNVSQEAPDGKAVEENNPSNRRRLFKMVDGVRFLRRKASSKSPSEGSLPDQQKKRSFFQKTPLSRWKSTQSDSVPLHPSSSAPLTTQVVTTSAQPPPQERSPDETDDVSPAKQ